MLTINSQQLIQALNQLGLRAGQGVLVHSALQYLGTPQGGLQLYLESLFDILGIIDSHHQKNPPPDDSQGTIVVPAFNFGFASGEPYDPNNSPSQGMGVFSELVRRQPAARRTPHPMQSFCILGHHADELASIDTPSAFDPGSAFERMLELDFDLLLLGANVQAISALHYSEQRFAVPYRYWKEFSGQVKTKTGWKTRTYKMFVRDLSLDPQLTLYPVQALLEERQQWQSIPLNYGQIARCRMVDFIAAVDQFLCHNPWSLVTNPPR
jgi:aminoglycoside 3-N-acetyltransferase